MIKLSDAEWKIETCLWDCGPMTITELTKTLGSTTGWSKNTIITFLKRMQEKGAISFVQEARAKRFYPLIDRAEAELEETTSFLDKVYKGNVGLMISNLISSDKLSKEEIRELQRILEED
ncbi:MAG: BlaI/MecI/CopY family transcriptional regulator [Clostridiales bacterium]|nr:BlaI/MecI/CopY family transcriptional regulator [Clostridiales bacterium]